MAGRIFQTTIDQIRKLEICSDQNVPVVEAAEFAGVMTAGHGTFAYLVSITFCAIIATGYSERSVRCSHSGRASETANEAGLLARVAAMTLGIHHD